ncbi:MAG: CpsD/CapB family tyrosine-protein kinase [Hyphomicrobiales bacterium]
MERIQSAIQKAREARQQPAEHSAVPKISSVPAPYALDPDQEKTPPVQASSDELWADLPIIELQPSQLHRARVMADQSNHISAHFDVMRTRMLHEMRTNNWRRVAITSPDAACGKTTLCLNLAFSFARQRRIKTMILDLDMRRPGIEKVLNQKMSHNFSSALEGKSTPEEHMVCYEGRLALATNCKPAQNPAELLQSKGAADVVDMLEARYQPDFMFFDLPPILACDDTSAFLDQVDCVLLIAEAERSTPEELKKCEREITTRTNFLGVVLNKCRYLDKVDSYVY